MRIYLILLVCFIGTGVSAQAVVGGVQSKGMDMNTQAYGFVTEIKTDTKEVTGSTYLYEQWYMGKIEFINGSKITGKLIRYNIKSGFVEIRLDDQKKGGADGRNIKSFEILNEETQVTEKYVNAIDFSINGTKLVGFLKELQVGELSLYSKTDVKLVKGAYVAALDMGEEDDSFSKKTIYYVAKESELQEVSTNKKRFASSFPEKEVEVLNYIKDQNLSLKNENDLVSVILFLNGKKV